MTDNQMTQWMLVAGVVAAGLFLAIATVEIFARPGFSINKHAISMLSLGERGWLMAAAFIVSGVLTLACAFGIWRATGNWGGLGLIGLFGAGLVLAGFFPAPAGYGFPPGTPDDMAPVMDTGATIHSIAFMLAFGSLILAALVMAVHFFMTGSALWGVTSLAAGLIIPALIALGVTSTIPPGIGFYWATVLAWAWLAGVALRSIPQGMSAVA